MESGFTQARDIEYPARFAEIGPNRNYVLPLLEQALSHSERPYRLQPNTTSIREGRALRILTENSELDIVWTMTTKEREIKLRAIPIPLFKGLIGWRIPLISHSNLDLFKAANTEKSVSMLRAGQVHDWPDTQILKWNHFSVESSSTYEGLFKMLASRRIDYYPRSALEVWTEFEERKHLTLAVDQHLVLQYPAAVYFFVRNDDEVLAGDLLKGLEKMIASGEFDRLFWERHGEQIRLSKFNNRHRVQLVNPLLPPGTPIERRELWFTP
jgi:hypothetical protein